MAPAATDKKKCQYGEKCYRKNKQHMKDFFHPGDNTADDEDKNEASSSKTPDKPRLVHDISVNEDDDMTPGLSRRLSLRKRKSDNESETDTTNRTPSTSKPSPAKVMKVDNSNVEKIAVDYSKAKTVTKAAASDDEDVDMDMGGASGGKKDLPKTIHFTPPKEKCKYWDKCYQTNDSHLKEFYHSGDDIPKGEEKVKKKRGQSASPANPLEDGGTVQFDSGYIVKRQGDIYSCSCKGFISQRAPINERSCKHLKDYNGQDFEEARTAANTKPKHVSQHIQVSLLLAHKYEEGKNNPVGWWISEKLDGVRAFWNGNCFYSRLGNAFYAPSWFTKDLPKDMHLDGELFGGRGEFQSTVSIVKTAESPKWKDIQYYVFDSPNMKKDPFEKRMHAIKDYFEDVQPKNAVFVEQTKCVSQTQLDQMLTYVLNVGGEGLMIREPKSIYEPTRSRTLLKIKKFYDAEAIVIGHERGKGVNSHRCGALRCRMACGKEFSVGSGLKDKDRNKPPKVGSIITYKFQELSKGGSPRFPTFVGLRIDMTKPKDAEIRAVMDE